MKKTLELFLTRDMNTAGGGYCLWSLTPSKQSNGSWDTGYIDGACLEYLFESDWTAKVWEAVMPKEFHLEFGGGPMHVLVTLNV